MAKPANLQGLTVKAAARLMNVSERAVYMARELDACGRPDLAARVDAGELSLLGALKLAKPEKYAKRPDAYEKLVKAFNACSEDEKARFIVALRDRLA